MADVDEAIKDIPAASRKVFDDFFVVAESAVSKAYTLPCVQQGWKIMGIAGPTKHRSVLYDTRQTMSQWKDWDKLSVNQQDSLLDLINVFADKLIVARGTSTSCSGTALDKDMEIDFQHLVGPLIYDCQAKDLALNRWRAILINDPSIYNFYTKKELLKEEKKSQKRSKKDNSSQIDSAASSVGGLSLVPDNSNTADVVDSSQTKVKCMLCKNSFQRAKGSKGLSGMPSAWGACFTCKKVMYCDAEDCKQCLILHVKHCNKKP